MKTLGQDLLDQTMTYYDNLIVVAPKVIMGLIIMTAIWLLAKQISRRTVEQLNKRSSDPLMSRFVGRMILGAMGILSILIFLQIVELGNVAAGILGTAGVGAFVIGFAFKDIGENFLAGFLLAFDRPFNIGDLVELGGEKGKVIALNLRNTQLKTFNGRDLYIPNAKIIKDTLVNYTIDGFMRQEIVIGLDYGSDVDKAISIILKEITNIKGVLTQDKKPSVAISALSASAINLTIYYWIDTFDKSINGVTLNNRIIINVLDALNKANFYMPGDIIEMKNYKSMAVSMENKSTPTSQTA